MVSSKRNPSCGTSTTERRNDVCAIRRTSTPSSSTAPSTGSISRVSSLAKVVLPDPDLLVLDEATSAVDPALEMRIGRALERLMSGRTSVTIAHRLSTAENADEVVVVDRGRVVQRGPHAELVQQEGSVYAGQYASWVAQHG